LKELEFLFDAQWLDYYFPMHVESDKDAGSQLVEQVDEMLTRIEGILQ